MTSLTGRCGISDSRFRPEKPRPREGTLQNNAKDRARNKPGKECALYREAVKDSKPGVRCATPGSGMKETYPEGVPERPAAFLERLRRQFLASWSRRALCDAGL